MSGLDPLVGRRELASPQAMEAFGVQIGRMLRAGDLVVLTGPLGAGKTTLTRGIAAGLGVRGPVQSPTFVIARTHPSLVGGPALVHVDAYRLGSALELDDLDLDLGGSVVVVEWGRGMVDGLADRWWEIELERLPVPAPSPGDLDSGDLDAGAVDAGALDAGAVDAGAVDAGALDAGAPRRATITRRP
ncbi:MAG: tRNA (adenosine(37)-N6)-threonylcarbamoyltransferase complex ATPase subunit type 1 TsaE [Microbacterium sp.]